MAKEKDGTISQDIIAKIPVQDTRLFYKRWENYENLNNFLLNEIINAILYESTESIRHP